MLSHRRPPAELACRCTARARGHAGAARGSCTDACRLMMVLRMASSAFMISGKVGRCAGSLARHAEPSAATSGGTEFPNSSFLFWMVTQKMICAPAASSQVREG